MVLYHKTYELFGKVLFERAIIRPPFKRPTSMEDEACFLHIVEGQNLTYAADGPIKIFNQESVLVKCGHYMTKMLGSETTGLYEAVVVHFYPEILRKVYSRDLPQFVRNPKPHQGVNIAQVPDDILLQKYIASILFYFENPEIVSEEILILKLKELIILLSKTKSAELVHEILSSLFSPNTYSFREIIEAHLYSDLTIADFSQLTNMSISSFKREFDKIYRQSPATYLRNKKLDRASELLTMTNNRISDIALDCGFTNLAHFSKSFSQRFALSPTEYRERQKSNYLA